MAEVADWWLIVHPPHIERVELREALRDQIAREHNRYPFLADRLLEASVAALMSPNMLVLRNRMRYEAIQRTTERWNLWPFDKRAQRLLQTFSKEQRTELQDSLLDWVVSSVDALEAEPARQWRFRRQWLGGGPRRFDEIPLPAAVKALRNHVLKRFEQAILECSARPVGTAPALFESTASAIEEPSDQPLDVPEDFDLLAALGQGATPRQREILTEIRLQIVVEARPKLDTNLAAERLHTQPATVRSHLRTSAREHADCSDRVPATNLLHTLGV